MKEFRITEPQYRKFQRRFLAIYIPTIALGIVVILIADIRSTPAGEFPIWTVLVPAFILYFSFIIYRTVRRQRRIMMTYLVSISDSDITRQQDKTPTISISFMEIKEIIKTKSGGFLVKGLDRTDVITIPKWLDETGELERALLTLAPITTDRRDPFLLRYRLGLRLLGIGLFICLLTVQNKIVIGFSALLLAGLIGWNFYEVQTSKNVTSGMKRSSWLLLLIIACILYLTYVKLTLPVF